MLRLVALAVLLLAALGGGVAAWALPGPQQALFPGRNALTEIAPGVFTDDPSRADDLLGKLASAEALVAGFWGAPPDRPRMVLCTTMACANRMGTGKRSAVAYGDRLVTVAPKGLKPMFLAHELCHIALHGRVGLTGLLRARFPAWFDEGLASWVSRDTRLGSPDAATRSRIHAARRAGQWNDAVTALGWRAAYGAALAEVGEMAEAQGPEALRALIDRVVAGADFNTERTALLGGRTS